jgi:trk system potassium uptake protein TrkH
MRLRLVFQVSGALLVLLAGIMLVPLLVSLYYHEASWRAFFHAMMVTAGVGLLGVLSGWGDKAEVRHREGFAIVTLCWTLAAAAGALPYLFAGTFASVVDAYFEAMSGFTTTGSTVLAQIEALPRGILFWRSMTQWLGGMGIILLSIAILPLLGVGGMQLFKAEVPGPVYDKLSPRIKDTAKTLWLVYLLFSLLEFVLLKVGGMSFFDAACHTFTTLATGGFSTRNLSVGAYNSAYIDGVITLFMVLAGINFALHYRFLLGDFRGFYKDTEFHFYIGALLFATLFVAWNLWGGVYRDLGTALRHAAFQVASIMTTTGYGTADYETWPYVLQLVLVLLMFLGGMAGSTGGGMKIVRIQVLIKQSYRELYQLIHPHAIVPVKLRGVIISKGIIASIWGYFFIFIFILVLGSAVMGFLGLDLITAFTSVLTCLANVGPGLGGVGPTDNFAAIPALGKWVLSLCMLIGRLEVYTVLVLFLPEFWRK